MNLPSGSQRIFGSTKKTTNGKCNLLPKVQLSHSADNAQDTHVPRVLLQLSAKYSNPQQISANRRGPTNCVPATQERTSGLIWGAVLFMSALSFLSIFSGGPCAWINRCRAGAPRRSLWNIQYFSHYHESTYSWKPHLQVEYDLRACSDRRHEWCDRRRTALRRGVKSPKMQYLLLWAAGNYDHHCWLNCKLPIKNSGRESKMLTGNCKSSVLRSLAVKASH